MQNKKIFLLSLILPIAFLAIFFVPKAFAAYDCAVAYPGSDSAVPASFTYDACCYPASSEPYQGVYCRPDDSVVRKQGSNPPLCSTYAEVLTTATSARTADKFGFNCFSGTISSSCRANYCKDPAQGNKCVAINGTACPSNLNRSQICPGGCGQCTGGYTYCTVDPNVTGGLSPTNLPNEVLNPTLSCSANLDGSTFGANAGKACAELGKNVLNPCTGECTGCPDGNTPSGRYLGVCVTYGARFLEIFDDGLTWLGGHIIDIDGDGKADDVDADGVPEDNAYDYSPTGPTGLKDTYLKSDIAWNLDWSNPDLPPGIKWLLTNLYTCKVDADCDSHGSGMSCSASGLCYTPGYTGYTCNSTSDCIKIDAGLVCDTNTKFCYYSGGGSTSKSCTNDSQCDWLYGFVCTDAGVCGLPGGTVNNYYTCSTDANCSSYGAGYKCSATGYCYNPNDGDGYVCDSNSDCDWLDGYICECDLNVGGTCIESGSCKVPTPKANMKAQFVGLTSTAYTGNLNGLGGGYKEANDLCHSEVETDSQVCTSMEIINSYAVSAITTLNGATGMAWVNNGAPGYELTLSNDCGSWVKSDVGSYGSVINFDRGGTFVDDSFYIQTCKSAYKFACCK